MAAKANACCVSFMLIILLFYMKYIAKIVLSFEKATFLYTFFYKSWKFRDIT